jgi:hypothetical protein
MEMMSWVVLEDAALDPVVGFESGADAGGSNGKGEHRAVDKDWQRGVRDVSGGVRQIVGFWRRLSHVIRTYTEAFSLYVLLNVK